MVHARIGLLMPFGCLLIRRVLEEMLIWKKELRF